MSYCRHDRLSATARRIARVEGENISIVEVRLRCMACGSAMMYRGMSVGIEWHMPMRSADGTAARLPIATHPEAEDLTSSREEESSSESVYAATLDVNAAPFMEE